MGTLMSAASSTERFPAPVPIGGTVRLVNSHSRACSSVERHARATPSRVTGSVSLRMTAWITNSAGRSPPPAVTYGVDHELRRQVAAPGGDHRRAHRELLLELQPVR